MQLSILAMYLCKLNSQVQVVKSWIFESIGEKNGGKCSVHQRGNVVPRGVGLETGESGKYYSRWWEVTN